MLDHKSKLVALLRSYFQFGFPLSRKAWERLELTSIAAPSDSIQASEVYLLRRLAERMSAQRTGDDSAPRYVHAGQLASAGVLVDVFRYIMELYCRDEQPGIVPRGISVVEQQRGELTVTQTPTSFVRLFPPVPVIRGSQSETDYLNAQPDAGKAPELVVRETILLYFSTANPAFRRIRELFDDTELRSSCPYVSMVQGLEGFFSTQPPLSYTGLTLFECLYAPIRACPDSIEGQIDFIRRHWAHFLPLELLERLLMALDILQEERVLRGLGPGPVEALRFDRDAYGIDLGYKEPAAFSLDAEWMSNVVLIAKSIYVWLFQLTRKYGRDIRLLSDIPDEELDQLARWGFSGLWLIGVWERSSASQKIKQIMGNPEAAASAYSLYDYVVAQDLGGEEAFQQLRHRAWQRGIRLASDMVPNHMGVYSKWMIEHPQWFLQADHPPFPVYQFNGSDLSEDSRVCIQIEDGYWQHRDAAVVFKRIDKWTGDTRYIYHGNDGTSMPWNDTAQLNFLLPEVREAVIQTILHVARKFPIIRFDAAMTLAKRHYQRLWFPKPGDGGAIPSRAERGMSRADFDAHMPKEFWREVVDRVTQELPDTLLLAEAFWLMEGYFVRTLGMHRVYNSAFMNMLKMEDNAKYRTTVRNVLEFSPEVLKRFVNFMNNPDERTAVDQFGKDDKYFGVAVLMVTMPGLPMFGHGQIEGFTEKYGMEYRRSYWDEQVDENMVRRHEAQIFPLMRRRHLFSGSANFAFFDFVTADGHVDESVFAYCNRSGGERAIVIYNNAYNTTRGRIHTSTAINVGDADQPMLVRRTLAEALALNNHDSCYYAFRDYRSGLEYIRRARQLAEQGLFAELHAYQYNAFLDFRELHDSDGSWHRLDQRLNGSGVPSLDEARREMQLEPILGPYRALMNPAALRGVRGFDQETRLRLPSMMTDFYAAVAHMTGSTVEPEPLVARFAERIERLIALLRSEPEKPKLDESGDKKQVSSPVMYNNLLHVAFAWLTVEAVGHLRTDHDHRHSPTSSVVCLDSWLLLKAVREAFDGFLVNGEAAHWDAQLVQILTEHSNLLVAEKEMTLAEKFRRMLVESTARAYLEIHRYENVLWLSKERLERMVGGLLLAAQLQLESAPDRAAGSIAPPEEMASKILDSGLRAGYQVDKLIALLE